MYRWTLAVALLAMTGAVVADPSPELITHLKASVVKVHVADQNNNHGVGTGVVVSRDHVATNCHVLANARGINIRKFGQNFPPVAILADWRHDLCVLRFHELGLDPVELGDSSNLDYEQPIFSIGFPLNTPKPQIIHGKIKALYPLDDSRIIRASASFRMGASGSPLLDERGRLIGISTFKSPGRNSYYYSLPVEWVKKLLNTEGSTSTRQVELPFWDAPENRQPHFMRVVLPYMGGRWSDLSLVAQEWSLAEPDNPEAWFYRGYAEERLGNTALASTYFQKTLTLRPLHPSALFELGLLASRRGDHEEYQRISMRLGDVDSETAQALHEAAAKGLP
jgi:hypothetical protein